MSLRLLAVLVVLAGCGNKAPRAVAGDKCARALARMAPLFEQAGNHEARGAQLAACHASLAKDPGREVWLDCILAIDGEVTQSQLDLCEHLDRQAIHGSASP
jgi:hypothetical protein